MLRVARTFVPTWAAAEDAVQDTWLAVIHGLDGFEGRSSLRTWVFTILANRARTRGSREQRTVPLSSLADAVSAGDLDSWVDPDRFRGPGDEHPGGWKPGGVPTGWRDQPESSVISNEAMTVLEAALEQLPARQQTVVRLRDVHDLSSAEVCAALDISAENQRVLLHRGRSRLRAVLEDHHRAEPA